MDFIGQTTRILADHQVQLSESIMAIGAFDGVHRVHQGLIADAVNEAREAQCPSVVWTFDPPPKVHFGRAVPLCTLSEKLARIANLGPDVIVVARFDTQYASRSSLDFISDLRRANPRRIHVGGDFRFGHKQSGNTHLLAEHFDVAIATPTACAAGETVSSTRIRALRAAGKWDEANALQGPFDAAQNLVGRLLTTDLRYS